MNGRITSVSLTGTDKVSALSDRLAAAQKGAGKVHPAVSDGEMSLKTAYDIQRAVMHSRQNTGDSLMGYKIGLTSSASQDLYSASEPIAGLLWDRAVFAESDPISLAAMHAPLVEVEVAFIMRSALDGPDVSAEDVLAATETIGLALEIVDSRWSGGQPGLGQIVADNANAAAVVMGPRLFSPDLDLSSIRVDARVGQQALIGRGTNVMGNPLHAVRWLAEHLSREDKRIEAGQIVLSGTLTQPTPIHPGDRIEVDIRGFGSMAVTIADE
jgi:2-keto-4-pentenoate hydratase